MFSIRPLPEFTVWLDGLKDDTVRGAIVARIKRLELGLMADVQPVSNLPSRASFESVAATIDSALHFEVPAQMLAVVAAPEAVRPSVTSTPRLKPRSQHVRHRLHVVAGRDDRPFAPSSAVTM
jgi:hypothetical protein